jgi:hypothetical protein
VSLDELRARNQVCLLGVRQLMFRQVNVGANARTQATVRLPRAIAESLRLLVCLAIRYLRHARFSHRVGR